MAECYLNGSQINVIYGSVRRYNRGNVTCFYCTTKGFIDKLNVSVQIPL